MTEGVVAISASKHAFVALRQDGSVVQWGADDLNPLDVRAPRTVDLPHPATTVNVLNMLLRRSVPRASNPPIEAAQPPLASFSALLLGVGLRLLALA